MAKNTYKKEETNELASQVRTLENRYISEETKISKYVSISMYEDIQKIDAYANSKFINGREDVNGNPMPFFNVVTAAENIWYRATEVYLNKIKLVPRNEKSKIGTYILNAKLHNWFVDEDFQIFVNRWGRTLARYGSAVPKFVTKDGKLCADVVTWNNLIVDPIDFESNLKIETIEYTEAQLYDNPAFDKDVVEALCEARAARTLTGKEKVDTRNDFIKVYEVHGDMELSLLTGNEKDDDTYVPQVHVISFVAGKNKGEFNDYTLFAGKESDCPYMLTHLIQEDGQTLSRGAVKTLFDVQWMTNHTAYLIKNQLELASKLIFQTSDDTFVGQNALMRIQTGDILVHKVNEPVTQIANSSHDITSLQSFSNQWKVLGNEMAGISESMLGINPPSGTAWRQTEAILNESHSLFSVMTDNKAMYLKKMVSEKIIPFIKKTQLNSKEEIVTTLNDFGIDKINAKYIKNKAAQIHNDNIKKSLLNGTVPLPTDPAEIENIIRQNMNANGAERYLTPDEVGEATWKQIVGDAEFDVVYESEEYNADKQAALTTLNTTLQVLTNRNGQPFTPEERLVFNKILRLTGEVSEVELDSVASAPQPAPIAQPAPQVAPQTGA